MKKLLALIATSVFSMAAHADLIDFTDTTVTGTDITSSITGTVDGVGFEVTSNTGSINPSYTFDGGNTSYCGNNPLACDIDGLGISDDEITAPTQVLSIQFDSDVAISTLYFLDLFSNGNGTEQAKITVDGDDGSSIFVNAISSGNGGYVAYDLNTALIGSLFQFSGLAGIDLNDGNTLTNDYALAGAEVNAVPVPAAAWLFGSGLLSFMGLRRKKA